MTKTIMKIELEAEIEATKELIEQLQEEINVDLEYDQEEWKSRMLEGKILREMGYLNGLKYSKKLLDKLL